MNRRFRHLFLLGPLLCSALTGKPVAETLAQANRQIWTDTTAQHSGATVPTLYGQGKLDEMGEEAQTVQAFAKVAANTIGDIADKRGNLREHEQNQLLQKHEQDLLAATDDPNLQKELRERINARGARIAANQSAYEYWK